MKIIDPLLVRKLQSLPDSIRAWVELPMEITARVKGRVKPEQTFSYLKREWVVIRIESRPRRIRAVELIRAAK
jgi:hypothetical protein